MGALACALFATAVLCSAQEFPKGLLAVEPADADDAVKHFVDSHMEPRHAVAVAVVPKGSKRHNLLLELGEDEDLRHLLAIGALFKKGRTSLVVHRYHYDALAYEGKWTRSAISSWLQEVAFPPVNYLPQFAPTKFLTRNPFGILLVVKPGHHSPELAKALEPHAARLKDKLKVSFFARTPSTQQLCEMYGVRSSDEFLLIERPKEGGLAKGHSHVPKSPKYRVENVSAADVDLFFKQYESGLRKHPEARRGCAVSKGCFPQPPPTPHMTPMYVHRVASTPMFIVFMPRQLQRWQLTGNTRPTFGQ
ncbi:unnamed protein product [Effrenium voratum]|nr:unnamed protein product [Effrenium voratum]